MHIVLINPLIPQNTGTIARMCAGTDSVLHLAGTLGFSLEDRYLKRAGLDYWPHVNLRLHRSFEEIEQLYPQNRFWFFSSHARQLYSNITFQYDDFLVFGSENGGLPDDIRSLYKEKLFWIPINNKIRSLNLANAVSIVLFEGLRQLKWEP
jgi:tRNA (cytidine/uridine-2'-O-)-methyltransferase